MREFHAECVKLTRFRATSIGFEFHWNMKRNSFRSAVRRAVGRALLLTSFLGGFSFGNGITAELAFQVVYQFSPYYNGAPAAVIQGSDGNLYGSSYLQLFRITLTGNLTNLYTLPPNYYPAAKLLEAADGNFYGTTTYPGALYGPTVATLFRLTPTGNLTTLLTFNGTNGNLGAQIFSPLIQTTDGNLFGTTYSGGSRLLGTLFEFRTDGVFSGLLSYSFDGTNGAGPHGGLIQTKDGSLFGTTTGKASYSYGGPVTNGTIFRISPKGDFITLLTFSGTNGASPWGSLLQAADGALYGTTSSGGLGYGTVFRITTNGDFTSLFRFEGTNGAKPSGELIQLADGNLYGTTTAGGSSNLGSIFRITTNGVLTSIFSFASKTGNSPLGGLCLAQDGNLYGTTSAGDTPGYGGGGTIFRLVSPPVLTSMPLSNGVQLTWTSFPHAVYRVEYRTNIVSGPWLTLATNVIGANTTTSYTDFFAGGIQRYYRVVLLPH
jgi:uncharacterized repeat protein (TIGR03803 family)